MSHSPPLYHWIDRFDAMRAKRRYGVVNDLSAIAFMLGILLLLAALPVPAVLARMSSLLDWATLLLLACVVYYFILSLPLALALLPVVTALAAVTALAGLQPGALPAVGSALVFAALCIDLVCQHRPTLRGFVEFAQLSMLLPLWRFHHAVQRKA